MRFRSKERGTRVKDRAKNGFHFLALVSFLAGPKPRIPFLGLSLLRNQTETLATQASYHTSLDHTNRVRNKQKWNDVYNAEKILTLLYVREKISNYRD